MSSFLYVLTCFFFNPAVVQRSIQGVEAHTQVTLEECMWSDVAGKSMLNIQSLTAWHVSSSSQIMQDAGGASVDVIPQVQWITTTGSCHVPHIGTLTGQTFKKKTWCMKCMFVITLIIILSLYRLQEWFLHVYLSARKLSNAGTIITFLFFCIASNELLKTQNVNSAFCTVFIVYIRPIAVTLRILFYIKYFYYTYLSLE